MRYFKKIITFAFISIWSLNGYAGDQILRYEENLHYDFLSTNTTLDLLDHSNGVQGKVVKRKVRVTLDLVNESAIQALGDESFSYSIDIELEDPTSGTTLLSETFAINEDDPRVSMEVDITAYSASTTIEMIKSALLSNVPTDQVYARLVLEIIDEVGYDVRSEVGVDIVISNTTQAVEGIGASNERVNLSWAAAANEHFDYFDIQMLKLEEDIDGDMEVDWKNAVVISVDNDQIIWEDPADYLLVQTYNYDMVLAEGSGTYAWRVRPIGSKHPGGRSNSANYGAWSSAITSGVYTGSAPAIPVTSNATYFSYTQFDEDINWTYNRVFTENSRHSETMTYANGLNQVQQVQTRLSSSNRVLGTQSVMDYSGRPALQTLPAPTSSTSNTISYDPTLFVNGNGTPYAAADFDDTPYSPSLPTGSGVNDYYSNSNNEELRAPNAENVPYTRSLFYNDATGRVFRQAGVGNTMRLNDDANTSRNIDTYYASVAQEELVRIFGSEAPESSSTYKVITVDPNDVTSVSYIAKTGQVLATCLDNSMNPSALLDAGDEPTGANANISINVGNNPILPGTVVMTSSQSFTLTNPLPINTYSMGYEIDLAGFNMMDVASSSCADICIGCDYKVEIEVICPMNPSVNYKFAFQITPDASTCSNPTLDLGDIYNGSHPSVTILSSPPVAINGNDSLVIQGLDPGTYLVSKKVYFYNQNAVNTQSYHQDYIDAIYGLYNTWSASATQENINDLSHPSTAGNCCTPPTILDLEQCPEEVCDLDVDFLAEISTKIEDLIEAESESGYMSGLSISPFSTTLNTPSAIAIFQNDILTIAIDKELSCNAILSCFENAAYFLDQNIQKYDSIGVPFSTSSPDGYDDRLDIFAAIYACLGIDYNTCAQFSSINIDMIFDPGDAPLVNSYNPPTINGTVYNIALPHPSLDLNLLSSDAVQKLFLNQQCLSAFYEGPYEDGQVIDQETATLNGLSWAEASESLCQCLRDTEVGTGNVDFSGVDEAINQCLSECEGRSSQILTNMVGYIEGIDPSAVYEGMLMGDLDEEIRNFFYAEPECAEEAVIFACQRKCHLKETKKLTADIASVNTTALDNFSSDMERQEKIIIEQLEYEKALNYDIDILPIAEVGSENYCKISNCDMAADEFKNFIYETLYKRLNVYNPNYTTSNLSFGGNYVREYFSHGNANDVAIDAMIIEYEDDIPPFLVISQFVYDNATSPNILEYNYTLYQLSECSDLPRHGVVKDDIDVALGAIFANNSPKSVAHWAFNENGTSCPLFSGVYSNIASIEQNFELDITADGSIYTKANIDYSNCASDINSRNVIIDRYNYGLNFGIAGVPLTGQDLKITIGNVDVTDGYINFTTDHATTLAAIADNINKGTASHNYVAIASSSMLTLKIPHYQSLFSLLEAIENETIFDGGIPIEWFTSNYQAPPIFRCMSTSDYDVLASNDVFPSLNDWFQEYRTDYIDENCENCEDGLTNCPAGYKEVIGGVKVYENFDLNPQNLSSPNPDPDMYNCMMADVAQFFKQALYDVVVEGKYSTSNPHSNSNYYETEMPIYLVYNDNGNRMPLKAIAKIYWYSGQNNTNGRSFGTIDFKLLSYPNCDTNTVHTIFEHINTKCENSGNGLLPHGTTFYKLGDQNILANNLKIEDMVDIYYDQSSGYMHFDYYAQDHQTPYYYNGCLMSGTGVTYYNSAYGSTGLPVSLQGGNSSPAKTVFDSRYSSYVSSHQTSTPCSMFDECSVCMRWIRPEYGATNIADLLPGEPGFTVVTDCEGDASLNSQYHEQQIENYLTMCRDQKLQDLEQNYRNICVDNFTDNLGVSYTLGYYHYTLYYYDRAGNLVTTVPPKGVNDAMTSSDNRGDHELATDYTYNSIKQLVRQETPDGGITHFWYNANGQLVLSQSAEQVKEDNDTQEEFSYTRYDNLGRIIEVGELHNTHTELYDPAVNNRSDYWSDLSFPNNAIADFEGGGYLNKTDITVTEYSTQLFTYNGQDQQNLRNRVSHTYTDRDGNLSTVNDQIHTYYSYDPHGNVQWLVQDLPDLGQKAIMYEYDLVSGNVNKVSYNKGLQDQYFHKYEYDSDNRITKVYTSQDEVIWDCDAEYEYFLHGPLKRMMIGEDKLQGLDYTYTIEGYLKSINQVALGSDDPGLDGYGASAYLKDEFAMELGYYSGDFNRSGLALGENGVLASSSGIATNDLFNGNISSWMYNTREQTGVINPITGVKLNTYRYDRLNRLDSNKFQVKDRGVWNDLTDYEETFTYDGNGNILTATRNAFSSSNNELDNLVYHYDYGNNQLSYVDELTTSPLDGTLNDIEAQNSDNYTYDANGNLIEDLAEKIKIDWNAYGKVSMISKYGDEDLADLIQTTEFYYDAAGNRSMKIVDNSPGDLNSKVTTYYVRDASGNIMANYKKEFDDSWVYTQTEIPLYGSSRLGVFKPVKEVVANEDITSPLFDMPFAVSGDINPTLLPVATPNLYKRNIGNKYYELSDHLGNVRVVLGDRRAVTLSTGGYTEETFVGTGTGGTADGSFANATLFKPQSIEIADNGDIYLASSSIMAYPTTIDIRVLDKSQEKVSTITFTNPNSNAHRIHALRIFQNQFLLLAFNQRIYAYDLNSGQLSSNYRNNTWNINDMEISGNHLYVSSGNGKQIRKYDLSTFDFAATDLGVPAATVFNISSSISGSSMGGIDVHENSDGSAVIYVAIYSDQVIKKVMVDPNGTTYTVVDIAGVNGVAGGNANGPGNVANFNRPYDVELSSDKNTLYVSQYSSRRIRAIDLSDIDYTVSSVHYYSSWTRTTDIKLDPFGDLFVVKNGTHEISKISTTPPLTAEPTVHSVNDYYSFGMIMPGRSFNSNDYRYGFNGKEKDDEIKGSEGSSYDFGARMYDPRIGKFLSIDPLWREYKSNSPYLYAGNNPVLWIDMNGEGPVKPHVLQCWYLLFPNVFQNNSWYGFTYIKQEEDFYEETSWQRIVKETGTGAAEKLIGHPGVLDYTIDYKSSVNGIYCKQKNSEGVEKEYLTTTTTTIKIIIDNRFGKSKITREITETVEKVEVNRVKGHWAGSSSSEGFNYIRTIPGTSSSQTNTVTQEYDELLDDKSYASYVILLNKNPELKNLSFESIKSAVTDKKTIGGKLGSINKNNQENIQKEIEELHKTLEEKSF